VAAAGAWGASFSMLLNQRKRLEESSLDDLKQLRKRGGPSGGQASGKEASASA
jgi:hypothetical protein